MVVTPLLRKLVLIVVKVPALAAADTSNPTVACSCRENGEGYSSAK